MIDNVPAVYGVFGHGCDYLTGRASDNIPIPPGIIYVTIAVCGVLSIDLTKLMYAFEDTSIWPALRYPVKYIDSLKNYFEDKALAETHIQIHKHGDDYIDSKNTFFFNANANILLKSGLYRLGEFQPVRGDIDIVSEEGVSRYAVTAPFSEDSLLAVYNGSIAKPQKYGPFANADEFKAANNIDINMSRMFHLMKEGDPTRTFVVYNFACRSVCGAYTPAVQGLSLARRAKNLPGNALGRNRIHPIGIDEQIAGVAHYYQGTTVDRFTSWVRRKRASEPARRLQFSFRAAQEETRKKSRSKSYMNLRKSRRSKTVSKGPKQRKVSGKYKAKAKHLTPIKEGSIENGE
jgi:hypothetical protein